MNTNGTPCHRSSDASSNDAPLPRLISTTAAVGELLSIEANAWFDSFASGRADLASNHDDILAEGFGRS